jgi:hypothetical protein
MHPLAPAAALPEDVQRVIDQLDEADRVADRLTGSLTDQQFHWRPDGGTGWSIGQCLEHLAVADALYAGLLRAAIDRERQAGSMRRGPFAPGFFGRKFASSLEPPAKLRTRAPSAIVPRSALTREEILRAYHGTHAELKAMARDAAAIDANRATFQNPFFKMVRVRVSTGFHVITAHNRRHLWQAERVFQRPDFPR